MRVRVTAQPRRARVLATAYIRPAKIIFKEKPGIAAGQVTGESKSRRKGGLAERQRPQGGHVPGRKEKPSTGLGLSDRDIEVATQGVWGHGLPLTC